MNDSEKIKVFCYLDNPTGRDTELVLPVAYTLETYFNCEITFFFLWDIYAIRRLKPDMVLLPNTKGHNVYFEISKYAYQNDIKVLALESEGDFRTDGSFEYWGYNTDKKIYQEWLTVWSDRTKQYLEKLTPEQRNKIVLTGGTGFDRYKICTFKSRETLLSTYGKEHYKKVIGYAGWAFGKIYSQHKEIAHTHIHPDRDTRFKWVEDQRQLVKGILKEAIENNPDTLFIFKKHPKESFESDITEGPNEMNELLDYDNVLYIKREELIHDLINVSDFWLGFETTTALESWLLGKLTVLINPNPDFVRNSIHLGSPKVDSHENLQKIIDEFYVTGNIEIFWDKQLEENRQQLIRDSIGFADGLNHVRACYYFSKSLQKNRSNKRAKLNLRHLRLYVLMHLGKYFFYKPLFRMLPGFKKSIYVFENMYLQGFYERKREVYRDVQKFHEINGVESKLHDRNWIDILGSKFITESQKNAKQSAAQTS